MTPNLSSRATFPGFFVGVFCVVSFLLPSPQYIHAAPRDPAGGAPEEIFDWIGVSKLVGVLDSVDGFVTVGVVGGVFGAVGVLGGILEDVSGTFHGLSGIVGVLEGVLGDV